MQRLSMSCLPVFGLLFIAVSINISFVEAKKECAITQVVAEEATKKLFFYGDREAVFPTNVTQINDYCKMIYSNVKTLTEYARCVKPFPKTVVGLILHTYKRLTKKGCADQNWKKSFIKLGTCVNQKNISEKFHVCNDNAISAFEYIANRFPVKDHILTSCCVMALMKSCLRDQGEPCGKDSSEFGLKLFDEPTAEGFGLICGSFNKIEPCNEKYGNYMKTIIEYLKKPKKPTKTFMTASMSAAFGGDFLV